MFLYLLIRIHVQRFRASGDIPRRAENGCRHLRGASTKQFSKDGAGGNVAAVAFYPRGEAGRFALQRQI